MKCPFCKSIIDVDIAWAIKNQRIFCGDCCKSFPVAIRGEEVEEKEEAKESLEEKWDKGVQEILGDEEEEDEQSAYKDDYSWSF
jgi:Fe-S-cluster containining protein